MRSEASPKRAVDKAEFASVIQDAATASSSIIDETMAMLNEQDTLDNVKAKLKNHLLTYKAYSITTTKDDTICESCPKLCKVCGRETYR